MDQDSSVAKAIDEIVGVLVETLNSSDRTPMPHETHNLADTLKACAEGLQSIATQLKWLGNADAATPMGAIEALGVAIKEAGHDIATSLSEIAQAINDHSS